MSLNEILIGIGITIVAWFVMYPISWGITWILETITGNNKKDKE